MVKILHAIISITEEKLQFRFAKKQQNLEHG